MGLPAEPVQLEVERGDQAFMITVSPSQTARAPGSVRYHGHALSFPSHRGLTLEPGCVVISPPPCPPPEMPAANFLGGQQNAVPQTLHSNHALNGAPPMSYTLYSRCVRPVFAVRLSPAALRSNPRASEGGGGVVPTWCTPRTCPPPP